MRGPACIAWTDPADGKHDSPDRHSGALTVVRASSTGGWVRQARCREQLGTDHAGGR